MLLGLLRPGDWRRALMPSALPPSALMPSRFCCPACWDLAAHVDSELAAGSRP